MKIENVEQVRQVLEEEGYEALVTDGSVITKIGDTNGIPAVFTISNDFLKINCQVATLGDIPEDNLTNCALFALSANTVINPFAFALIDATDDPTLDNPEDFKVILTDKVPVGDLSREELVSALNSLWSAVAESRRVLQSVA
jgi:hypothetical protein